MATLLLTPGETEEGSEQVRTQLRHNLLLFLLLLLQLSASSKRRASSVSDIVSGSDKHLGLSLGLANGRASGLLSNLGRQ